MINKITYTAAVASLAFLIGAPASFATSSTKEAGTTSTAKSTTPKMISDAQFAKEAAEGGMAQVKLGELAEQKGTSQEVKDFGKRMIADHTKAEEQLKTAATTDKIALPTTLNAKEQATYDRLSKLSGEAFDRAYARDMVADHRADIATFRSESNNGKDTAVKDFAAQTVPTLETHLKLASTMLQEVSKTSSNKKTTAPSGN